MVISLCTRPALGLASFFRFIQMASNNNADMLWHDDGHSITLRINRSELEVLSITCPKSDDRKCASEEHDCVVEYYIHRFGMECNAGVCPAAENIPICWTLLGDQKNLDLAQVWFMPKTDELFSAWLIATKNP